MLNLASQKDFCVVAVEPQNPHQCAIGLASDLFYFTARLDLFGTSIPKRTEEINPNPNPPYFVVSIPDTEIGLKVLDALHTQYSPFDRSVISAWSNQKARDIVLNRRNDPSKQLVVPRIESAIQALDDLGCEIDYAHVIDTNKGGGDYSMFIYEAHTYSSCRDPHAPTERKEFRRFLRQAFEPFLFTEDPAVRPIISVHKPAEYSAVGNADAQLTMLLYIKREFSNDLHTSLGSRADSVDSLEGAEYCLD